jgi:hypothetical protein
MADKKVSALVTLTNLSQDDLFMVVDDPAGTPTSKKVTVGNLFGNVAVATTHKALTTFTANTVYTGTTATFSANVMVGGLNIKSAVEDKMQVANTNTLLATKAPIASPTFTGTVNTPKLIISTKIGDPTTSNAVTEGVYSGTIAYSNTYLYIVTDDNTIKRIALSTF